MYATESAVRALAKNVKGQVSLADIQLVAAVADAEIDSALHEFFSWPNGKNGQPVNNPPANEIVQVANLMTAGLLEQRSYAQVEGGESPPMVPYGAKLLASGRKLLAMITAGTRAVRGLEMDSPTRGSRPPLRGQKSLSTFQLNGAFTGRSAERGTWPR